jgi:PAC2 family
MFTPITSAKPPAFSKQTLVLVIDLKPFSYRDSLHPQPVISKGNVGQLACDLLIASLSLERIGFLDSSALVPVIGSREDGVKGVSTPLEGTRNSRRFRRRAYTANYALIGFYP